MVKHIILWKLKDFSTEEEKLQAKLSAKENLEALKEKLEGIVDIKVQITGLSSSNADMMLDSTFVDEDALKAYQVSKEHTFVANTFVRPIVETRLCLDYNV